MYRDARAYTKKFLKVKEVAYCLDVSRKTVINYINSGMLKGIHAGRNCAWLIPTVEVIALQEGN